jgi:hypothetical protein
VVWNLVALLETDERVRESVVMPKGLFIKLLCPSVPTITLATLHIILCFVVESTFSEDGWKWFLVAIIDFPASNWIKQLNHPFESFLILGTLWWYGIGVVVRFFYLVFAPTANRNSE